MGTHPPPQKGSRAPSPIFGPFLLWPNGWMHQDATWYGARPQPRVLCVRWGPSPLPKKGAETPPFAHVYCDQRARWIKMALGMEVRPQPRRLCFRWGPSPSQKGGGAPSPIFGKFQLCPNGWMHQDATWYGGRPQPRGLCV